MHNLKTVNNDGVAPGGSVQEHKVDCEACKSFNNATCQNIRNTLPLIVTCPVHLFVEAEILIFRYSEEIISILRRFEDFNEDCHC